MGLRVPEVTQPTSTPSLMTRVPSRTTRLPSIRAPASTLVSVPASLRARMAAAPKKLPGLSNLHTRVSFAMVGEMSSDSS